MAQTLSSEERSMRAKVAAHEMHSKHDVMVVSAPGRKAANIARFEREVDPNGKLDPEERARRADHARKAHMARLAYKSARARRKKKS